MAFQRGEGFRVVGVPRSGDPEVTVVLPLDDRGRPRREGSESYEAAMAQGDHMLTNGAWVEYQVERFYYRK